MLKNLKAFTLAEIMLVMAIIGVVAVLTLPTLGSNMEEKKVVSALRKIYPELEASYTAMVRDYGSPAEWDVPSDEYESVEYMNTLLDERISKYMNVSSDCGTGTGCFPSFSFVENDTNYVKYLLKDGSSVAMSLVPMQEIRETYIGNGSADSNDHPDCPGYLGEIYVDVNGPKGENMKNYDIFNFQICYPNGIVPMGINRIDANDKNYTAGWVLKVGNRDYLKCNDLNWETKTTCN